MTLPERLAREAIAHDPDGCDEIVGLCDGCHYRPAIEAAIREAIEACAAVVADELSGEFYAERGTREAVLHRIRNLLTDEETP